MESIFLILSGVILAAGVLYWFWSHIQLTQKKVQLLENAVFELRGLVTSRSSPEPVTVEGEGGPVYKDLADDEEEEDWSPDASVPGIIGGATEIGSTPLSELSGGNSDLQPGGRLEVPSESEEAVKESEAETTEEQFRELFVQRGASESSSSPPKVSAPVTSSETTAPNNESLESMPVKDLRRLAEQRGLTGVSDMRKKEILTALRQQITSAPSVTKVEDVVVERTLDLTVTDDLAGEATVLE